MSTAAQTNLDVIVHGVDKLSPELQKMESKVIRFVGAIGASLAAIRAASFPITAAAAFEREMANVTKTTNFSYHQINQLSSAILDLSLTLDVSAENLAKVAAAAGQQGLGREGVKGVLAFTASVARMASVLDIEPEDAAKAIGKIANIFKLSMDQLENAVSSFNQTSNNSTASGKELLDVVRRIGDASGTINLSQSIGLAASALDFGVSPEQAGTNMSKVFATMLQKSDEFGKRLGYSARQWADLVSKDGIAGFKKVLAYLRTLDKGSQSKAITKLFGGGSRGGSLLNKYVGDADNAVLDRDLGQAQQGYQSGTSAILEQAIKQNTLASQSIILLNAVKKDAIEAGDQISGPLLRDVKDLREALNGQGVRTFITDLVSGLGDVINFFSRVIRYTSSLKINWENLIQVGKVWVALKLADVGVSVVTNFFGLDRAMKNIAASAKAAAVATKAVGEGAAGSALAGDATGGGLFSTKDQPRFRAAWAEVKAQRAAAIAQINQQKAATKAAAEADAKWWAARQREAALAETVGPVKREYEAATVQTADAAATMRQTRDAQGAQKLASVTAYNAKMEAIEVKHQAKLVEIETTYESTYAALMATSQAKRAETQAAYDASVETKEIAHQAKLVAIQDEFATAMASAKTLDGRTKAGKAARAAAQETLAQSLADEEASYSKSVAMTHAHWSERLAIQDAAYAKEMEEATALMERKLAREDQSYTQSLVSTKEYWANRLETEAAGYTALLDTQAETLAEMEDRQLLAQERMLEQTQSYHAAMAEANAAEAGARTASAATTATTLGTVGVTAMGRFATAASLVTLGIKTLIQWLTRATLVVYIIYTLADAVGLVDKAGGLFNKLGAALGLTSVAMQREAVSQAAAAEKTRKHNEVLQEQIDTYHKLLDAQGNYSEAIAKSTAGAAGGSEDADTRSKAHTKLNDAAGGATVELKQLEDGTDKKAIEKQIVALQAEIEKQKKKVADLQISRDHAAGASAVAHDTGAPLDKLVDSALPKWLSAPGRSDNRLATANTELKEAQEHLSQMQKTLADAGAILNGSATEALKKAAKNAKEIATAYSQIYSGTAADIAQKYLPGIQKAIAEHDAAKAAASDADVAQQDLNKSEDASDPEKQAAAAARAKEATDAAQAAEVRLLGARADLIKKINDAIAQGTTLTDNEKNALRLLKGVVSKGTDYIERELNGLSLVKKFKLAFTASADTANPDKPSSGDAAYVKEQRAEKNQAAKARIKLANATIEAETAINAEHRRQELSADERMYQLGTQALSAYFARRKAIQLAGIDDDVAARTRELAAVQLELKQALDDHDTKAATKDQYRAEIVKLQGQIDVLTAHKDAVIKANKDAEDDAKLALSDKVAQGTAEAFANGTLYEPMNQAFDVALASELASYRVWLAQLRTEAAADAAKGTPKGATDAAAKRALAEAVEASARERAFEATLQPYSTALVQNMNALAQYQQQLEILRGSGAMTSAEAESAYNQAIQKNLDLLKAQLAQEEELLAAYKAKGDVSEVGYQREAQAIEDTKLQLASLAEAANQTAKAMNDTITNGLADALGNLKPTMKSLKDSVLGFIHDIAANMQQQLGRQFAEDAMKKLTGGDNSKGPGGWLAEHVFGVTPSKDAGATAEALANGPVLGSTVGNPLYVRDADRTAALGTPPADGTPLGTLPGTSPAAAPGLGNGLAPATLAAPGSSPATPLYTVAAGAPGLTGGPGAGGVAQKVSPDATAITKSLNTTAAKQIDANQEQFHWSAGMTVSAMGVVAGAVNGNKAQMITSLLTLGTQVVAAIWGSAALKSGTSSIASAHTGGVLGTTGLRRRVVDPRVFASATRYHTGGVVGLAPNEVPIIGKMGEEMLTENDPRHRNNGGGASGGQRPLHVQQTLILDTDAAAKALLTSDHLITAIKPNVQAIRSLLGVK